MPSSASLSDVEGDEQAVVPPHHDACGLRQCGMRGPPLPRETDCLELLQELLAREALGVRADGGAVERRSPDTSSSAVGERRGRVAVGTSTPVTPSTTVSRRRPPERDDRAAARLGFDRHHAEILDPGQQRRRRPR